MTEYILLKHIVNIEGFIHETNKNTFAYERRLLESLTARGYLRKQKFSTDFYFATVDGVKAVAFSSLENYEKFEKHNATIDNYWNYATDFSDGCPNYVQQEKITAWGAIKNHIKTIFNLK